MKVEHCLERHSDEKDKEKAKKKAKEKAERKTLSNSNLEILISPKWDKCTVEVMVWLILHQVLPCL